MATCDRCAAPCPGTAAYCPSCGARVLASSRRTMFRRPSRERPRPPPSSQPSGPAGVHARADPRGRYRIRPARARRHGGGLPRRRPEARQPVALKFLPRALRRTTALLDGSTPRCARRGRSRTRTSAACTTSARSDGAALPLDGVRGRRGSRVAPAADRPAAAGQGARDRAPAVRGSRRRARPRRRCTAI